MIKKWFLVVVMLLSLLVIGCGIPQGEHDAALAERDAALAERDAAQDKVVSLQSDLDKAESEIDGLEGDIAEVQSQLQTLKSDVTDALNQIGDLREELALSEDQLFRMEEVFGELLFFDDFKDGLTEGWDSHGTMTSWSVVQDDGNYILQSLGQDGKPAPLYTNGAVETMVDVFIVGGDDWTDYTLEFRIMMVPLTTGARAMVNLKYTPNLSLIHPYTYYLGIAPNIISLHKMFDSPTKHTVLLQRSEEFESWLGNWSDIKVEVYGANIKAYVDGILHIDYTDPEPLEKASISIATDLQDAYIYLDDVLVTRAK